MGPGASVFFMDSVLKRQVKLFDAMLRHSREHGEADAERTADAMVAAVCKESTAPWTAEEVQRVWAGRYGDGQMRDQDYIDVLLLNGCTIPGRPEFLKDGTLESPVPSMQRAAQTLVDAGSSAICILCSTAHVFRDGMLEGVRGSGVKFIDMPRLAIAHVLRALPAPEPGSRVKIGLMGTEPLLRLGVYQNTLRDFLRGQQGGVDVEMITVPSNEAFNEAIFAQHGIKAGFDKSLECPHTFHNFELLVSQLMELRKAGAQAIILGCTELPLLLNAANFSRFGDRVSSADGGSAASLASLVLVDPLQVLCDTIIHASLTSRP